MPRGRSEIGQNQTIVTDGGTRHGVPPTLVERPLDQRPRVVILNSTTQYRGIAGGDRLAPVGLGRPLAGATPCGVDARWWTTPCGVVQTS
jgi:hypothetical protein